jgi:DNA-binding XRE family transcriptional regulator
MSTTDVIVENGNRMMTHAKVVVEGVELTFADDCKGVIPFADLPEIGKFENLARIELPNPYEVFLFALNGKSVEIPWDFARHFCDSSYQLRVEEVATEGRQAFGKRVRQLREAASLTQDKLAKAAGIGRVTLVRIERGEQSPRYENIIALADALGVPPERLLVTSA